jgi:riboflavin kinase/FMN adenylyltransferase
VYAGCALVAEQTFAAAISIGVRPTVNTGEPAVEAYLLDFDGDLYGRRVRLEVLRRLRDERRFGSVEELRAQIDDDVARVRALVP